MDCGNSRWRPSIQGNKRQLPNSTWNGRTTVPVLEQKATPKPEPTAYKPAPAKLPETGSNDSSNQTLLGLGIMLAGFGLATSARKSKEQ